MRIAALFCGCLFVLCGSVLAEGSLLLLDRSGSMKPYYAEGVVEDLATAIGRAAEGGSPVRLAVFSTDAAPLASLERIGSLPYGDDTYLDRALQYALDSRCSIAWIVTDNIQDQAGATNTGNTQIFYEKLKKDAVHRVTIFPLLQPAGRAGLVIYALLLDAGDLDQYETQVGALGEQSKGRFQLEALHMKPLDRDTVDINMVQDGAGPNGAPRKHNEGEAIRETVSFRFRSKLKHLRIDSATIEVSKSQAEFGPDSLLTAEKREVSISPVTVENLEPGGETEQVYQVTFDLGRVRLKKNLASLWGAAFGHARETQELTFSFVINVPQRNFRFKKPFLANFNAPTPSDAKATGRVYGIEALPVLVGEQATIILSERKFPIQITYPFYPALIFFGLFLVAAAIVGGGVYLAVQGGRRLLGGKKWTVETFSVGGGAIETELTEDGEIHAGGERLGSVKDSRFEVSEGGGILEPAGHTVKLEDGLRVPIRTPGGRTLQLLFRSGAGAEGSEAGDTEEPTRR